MILRECRRKGNSDKRTRWAKAPLFPCQLWTGCSKKCPTGPNKHDMQVCWHVALYCRITTVPTFLLLSSNEWMVVYAKRRFSSTDERDLESRGLFYQWSRVVQSSQIIKKNFIALCFECFFSYGKTVSSSMTFGSPTIIQFSPFVRSRTWDTTMCESLA